MKIPRFLTEVPWFLQGRMCSAFQYGVASGAGFILVLGLAVAAIATYYHRPC